MHSDTTLLDRTASDFVQNSHNRHLIGIARSLTGWWNNDESNVLKNKLVEAGLNDEQRRVVWSIISTIVADSFHGLVHEIDQELTTGRLVLELREGEVTERVTTLPYMAMAYSVDCLQAAGLDPDAVYQEHLRSRQSGGDAAAR